MTQRVVGAEQGFLIRYGGEVFIQHFFGVYDRTYLQQVESARFILFAAHGGGKLYLDGAAHFLLTILQYQLQDACQRENVMLQDVGESDYLASTGIQTIADNLVVRIVGRGYIVQCSILFRLFHVQFQQVEAIVHREIVSGIAQIEGIETGLRLFQGYLHFTGL